jgi:hypothetical protein
LFNFTVSIYPTSNPNSPLSGKFIPGGGPTGDGLFQPDPTNNPATTGPFKATLVYQFQGAISIPVTVIPPPPTTTPKGSYSIRLEPLPQSPAAFIPSQNPSSFVTGSYSEPKTPGDPGQFLVNPQDAGKVPNNGPRTPGYVVILTSGGSTKPRKGVFTPSPNNNPSIPATFTPDAVSLQSPGSTGNNQYTFTFFSNTQNTMIGYVTLPQPPSHLRGVFSPANPQDIGKINPSGEPGSIAPPTNGNNPDAKPLQVILYPPQSGQKTPTFVLVDSKNPVSGLSGILMALL